MALNPYGGYIWSNEPAIEEQSPLAKGMSFAVAAGLGAGAWGMAVRPRADGTRPLDMIHAGARTVGNLSPFSLLNTFRVPEFISPFISPIAQGMTLQANGSYGYKIGSEHLGSSSTFEYLKATTGKSGPQLQALGLNPGVSPTGVSLFFERGIESSRGSLYLDNPAGRHLLSSSMMMYQATPDQPGVLPSEATANKALQGTMQVLGLTEKDNFKAHEVFKHEDPKAMVAAPKFFPAPSITGQLDSTDDLVRRSAYLRSYHAFGMERLNSLVGEVGRQLPFIGDFNQGLDKVFGSNLMVKSGPASSMYARYGIKAGGLVAAGLAVSQLDWARREYGVPGEIVASGAISAGVMGVAHRMQMNPRNTMMLGVASFFGQMILPGFDQGIMPGIATTFTKGSILRAQVSPVSHYRRALEGYLPGVSDWQTGALLGIGGVAAVYAPIGLLGGGFAGRTLPQYLSSFPDGMARFGIDHTVLRPNMSAPVESRKSVAQLFWNLMEAQARTAGGTGPAIDALHQSYVPLTYKRVALANLYANSNAFHGQPQGSFLNKMNSLWQEAEDTHRGQNAGNTVNAALEQRLVSINNKYSGATGIHNSAMRYAEGAFETFRHSIFGADPTEKEFVKAATGIGFSPKLGRAGAIFGGLFAAHGLLTGSFLGSMESSEELQDIYSGRQLVEIKKSRWWEGGGTPFEGGLISYMRPHWYSLMMNRVREKGVWGEDDNRTPIGKFITKNFTYDWEREHYYDRPYPISDAAFSDIPVIGGILGATVGRLIKPARLMHVNEWVREGPNGPEFASINEGFRREPSYELGAKGPGIPGTAGSFSNVTSRTIDQFRNMEGLTGWGKSVLTKMITGSDGFTPAAPILASSGDATSLSRMFQEANTGGFFFSNEVVRRFLYKDSSSQEKQNPIANTMPSWLPLKLRYGDAYRSVEWGEARLPGAGYAAMHPDLKGIDLEAYPLIHRYAILSDVAPNSTEFRQARGALYNRRKTGSTTESENRYMDSLDSMLNRRVQQMSFDHVNKNAVELPGSSLTQSLWGGAQKLLREGIAPVEYMIPMGFRPVQKLMSDRGAIEEYEHQRLYGCLAPLTLVQTERGMLPIELVVVGDLVYTGSGKWEKVVSVAKKELKDLDLYPIEIKPAGLCGTSYILTNDHKVLIGDNNWKRVDELGSSDLLAYPLPLWMKGSEDKTFDLVDSYPEREKLCFSTCGQFIKPGSLRNGKLSSCNRGTWVPRYVVLDEALGELLGFYLSEGSLGRQNGKSHRIDFSFHAKEKAYHSRVVELMERIFGLSGSISQVEETQGVVLHFSSTIVASFFKSLCPGTARFKRMAPSIFPSRIETLTSILKSIIEGDGHTPEGVRTVQLTTASVDLANQVLDIAYLLNSLGTISIKTGSKGERSFSLKWNGTAGANLSHAFNWSYKSAIDGRGNTRSGFIADGFVWRKIRKVDSVENSFSFVYDLEVRNAHSFSGFGIVYHNSNLAFWDKPWRDWFRPATYSLASFMGFSGKPAWRQEADNVNAHFDSLEFIKWMRIAEQAKAAGDTKLAVQAQHLAGGTRMGVNPQGSPMGMYWSLPAEERPFFNAFSMAQGSERDRVLEMVPGDQKHLYQTLWKRADQGDSSLWGGEKPTVDDAYMARRFNEIQSDPMSSTIPREDWVGWHSEVALDDVKVMYVDRLGRDIHDFGLWESQLREAARQPYLEGSTDELMEDPTLDRFKISSDLYRTMSNGIQSPSVITNSYPGDTSYGSLTLNDNRDYEIMRKVRARLDDQ